jgi:hypothetical protein
MYHDQMALCLTAWHMQGKTVVHLIGFWHLAQLGRINQGFHGKKSAVEREKMLAGCDEIYQRGVSS